MEKVIVKKTTKGVEVIDMKDNVENKPLNESFPSESSPEVNQNSPERVENGIIAKEVTNGSVRRSGRRKSQIVIDEPKERKHAIRKLVGDSTMKDIHGYYLDKKMKRLHPSLETIFEEPLNEKVMSARKFKRTLLCHNPVLSVDKNKIRKRSLKAKKVGKIKKSKKKVAMDLLMKKLSALESNEED